MKKGQVFCRARLLTEKRSGRDPVYRYVNADVLDLDELSFRAFTIGILFRAGAVVGITDDIVPGDHITLEIAEEHQARYLKEWEKEHGK